MIYRGLYYPHNIDFIWQSAGMQGRSAEMLRAAREFAGNVPAEMIKQMPDMETGAAGADDVASCASGAGTRSSRRLAPPRVAVHDAACGHYARGIAYNARGGWPTPPRAGARWRRSSSRCRRSARSRSSSAPETSYRWRPTFWPGDGGQRPRDMASAERLLRAAVAEQDTHWFTRAPPWYFPVRQSLGAILLQAGRPADAEAVYREDLRRNPSNGWSLLGLSQSLTAQGKTVPRPAQAEAAFRTAWARADVMGRSITTYAHAVPVRTEVRPNESKMMPTPVPLPPGVLYEERADQTRDGAHAALFTHPFSAPSERMPLAEPN